MAVYSAGVDQAGRNEKDVRGANEYDRFDHRGLHRQTLTECLVEAPSVDGMAGRNADRPSGGRFELAVY
ncbi:hypothetical protein D3C75_908840 [compost metagenome]